MSHSSNTGSSSKLSPAESSSVIYHDIFDYPLTLVQLKKWRSGIVYKNTKKIVQKKGFYFLKGREKLIRKRLLRQKASLIKFEIAKKASNVLSKMPTVLMVGITGSLAMKHAGTKSDIDFMIITRKNTLWLSRFFALIALALKGISVRRFGEKDQKDKLCLNLWLSEDNLSWKKKNIFTAHEILQVVPLVNKNKTYEKFLAKNKWIKLYWPSAVLINSKIIKNKKSSNRILSIILFIFNYLFFALQIVYMKTKITKEIVKPDFAAFHPVDWSGKVEKYLKSI